MIALGKVIALVGFLGVLGFAVVGLTGNLWIGLGFHAVLSLGMIGWWIWYAGSLSQWYQDSSSNAGASMRNQALTVLISLLFAAAGVGVIGWSKPAEPQPGTRPMNAEEIRYFGSIFLMVGIGVFLMTAGNQRKGK